MRDAILAKLSEVETMIDEATCSGDQLAECGQCYKDIMSKLSSLEKCEEAYVD